MSGKHEISKEVARSSALAVISVGQSQGRTTFPDRPHPLLFHTLTSIGQAVYGGRAYSLHFVCNGHCGGQRKFEFFVPLILMHRDLVFQVFLSF